MTVNATTSRLAGLWPLFGLLIETPRLQLRLPCEDELPALAEAARDIAGPDGPRLQMPWMYGDSPDMERQLLQRHWRAPAHWKTASWHLPLAVFLAAEPAGMQDLWAEEFARRRSVGTGSWITRTGQGRGYDTEARAAVLDLAFAHLDALEALTEYTEGNHASERFSRKLGYAPNGQRARPPRRRRPRHRVPAPPRPPRVGKPRPARPHRRHRPGAVPAHARPDWLRGPGMRHAAATGSAATVPPPWTAAKENA